MLESIQHAKIGSIVPVYKELDEEIDALEYFAKLSNYGRKKNSLLIEHGHKTIGSANPCLVVSGKGNDFEIKALNGVGKRFLQFIKKDFGFCDKAVYGRDKIYGTLTPSRRAVSEDQRLKAKTHMDIIRTVAFSFNPTTKPFMLYCGMFGIVSYDFVDNLEDLPSNEDEMNDPDYILYFLDNMFIVDHKANRTYFVANALVTDNKKEKVYEQCNKTIKSYEKLMSKKLPKGKKFKKKEFKISYDMGKEEFLNAIRGIKSKIADGDILCAAPSRIATCNYNAEPFDIYAQLKDESRFYITDENGISMGYAYDSFKVIGEDISLSFATNVSSRDAEDKDLDNKYETMLRIDEEGMVKHTMMVDAARNEIAKISKAGTRHADKLFFMETHEHTRKVASRVKGSLREGIDSLHAFLSTINFSAGIPKVSSMNLLRKLEKSKRGFHYSSLVIINPDKDLDSKTTWLVRIKKDKIYLRAGSYVYHLGDARNIANKNENKFSRFFEIIKSLGGLK